MCFLTHIGRQLVRIYVDAGTDPLEKTLKHEYISALVHAYDFDNVGINVMGDYCRGLLAFMKLTWTGPSCNWVYRHMHCAPRPRSHLRCTRAPSPTQKGLLHTTDNGYLHQRAEYTNLIIG